MRFSIKHVTEGTVFNSKEKLYKLYCWEKGKNSAKTSRELKDKLSFEITRKPYLSDGLQALDFKILELDQEFTAYFRDFKKSIDLSTFKPLEEVI